MSKSNVPDAGVTTGFEVPLMVISVTDIVAPPGVWVSTGSALRVMTTKVVGVATTRKRAVCGAPPARTDPPVVVRPPVSGSNVTVPAVGVATIRPKSRSRSNVIVTGFRIVDLTVVDCVAASAATLQPEAVSAQTSASAVDLIELPRIALPEIPTIPPGSEQGLTRRFRGRRGLPVGHKAVQSGLMVDAAIAIDALEKTYAGGKRALDGVTLDVPRGSIFGLLGPNGAGKSTLINILSGMVQKSGGRASIWGFDIDAHPRNAKASIGVVPQEILFDPFFTPFETLELFAGLYGVPKDKRRSMDLLRAVHLDDKANAYARTLSGGMKRRLLVAKAMVHSPPILVLDEPTAGVDIELRQQLWAYVRELNAQGVTIVLTTHYLEEAEELCDRIAIINHGRLIANEPTRVLTGMAQEKIVEVTIDRDLTEAPASPVFEKITLKGERVLSITYSKARANAGDVLAAVADAGLGVVDVSTREADLEHVFLNLTRSEAAVG